MATPQPEDTREELDYKLVPLSRGLEALVDAEDYDFAMQYKWYADMKNYAKRYEGKRGSVSSYSLYNQILERKLGYPLPEGVLTDHINGNPLDCRRRNLRPATRNQNNWNSRQKNKSGFVGVYLIRGRYEVYITAFYTQVYIGAFDTAEEAAWMRDQYTLALHDEYGVLNFNYEDVSVRQLQSLTKEEDEDHAPRSRV